MERTISGWILMIVMAATAGCQTTGTHPVEASGDALTVTRTIPARFDAVKSAMKRTLEDEDIVRDIAGFPYPSEVQTSWRTWKTPLRKYATRDMAIPGRTLAVKVEQQGDICVVTARVATGKGIADDPLRSAALLDRISASIEPLELKGRRATPNGAG
jgi:hypothetical protein